MKNIFYITAFFFLSHPLSAQELISAQTDSLIKLGIRLSIEQSYDQAYAIYSKITKEQPESPVGYFFQAAVLHSQMMDYEIYDHENEFYELINKTIELSNLRLKKNYRDSWAYFFRGSGYGYLAFYQAKQKRFVDAFQNGRRSIKALEMAIKTDSTLYDVYLGLGTYRYYRSKFSRYLNWLPFVTDERAAGIAMIRKAINKGTYSRFSAINSFGWIALEEKNYDEGWQMVNLALEKFPHSRVFLWCAAKLAAKLGHWQKAVDYYNLILSSLKKNNVLSPYNELICRKNLHHIYIQLKQFQMARAEYQKIQQIKKGKEDQKRFAPILKDLDDFCSQHEVESALGKSTN